MCDLQEPNPTCIFMLRRWKKILFHLVTSLLVVLLFCCGKDPSFLSLWPHCRDSDMYENCSLIVCRISRFFWEQLKNALEGSCCSHACGGRRRSYSLKGSLHFVFDPADFLCGNCHKTRESLLTVWCLAFFFRDAAKQVWEGMTEIFQSAPQNSK